MFRVETGRATANRKFRDPGHPKPQALNTKDPRVVGVWVVLCPWYGPLCLDEVVRTTKAILCSGGTRMYLWPYACVVGSKVLLTFSVLGVPKP